MLYDTMIVKEVVFPWPWEHVKRGNMRAGEPIIGFRIEVIVEPDDTGFHAYCPALKGLHTCGDTEEEALRNAKDAAIAYLQSSIKHGDPIPIGVVMQEEVGEAPNITTQHVNRHTQDLEVACAIS